MEAEHRVQLDLLQALREALAQESEDRSASGTVLKQLLDYSEAHFLSEQLLMRLYAYPAYEEHVQEHEHLLETLRGMSHTWVEGSGEAPGHLLTKVEDWLRTHMSTTDQALDGYLSEHRPRPA